MKATRAITLACFGIVLLASVFEGRSQCVPASTAAGALDTCFGVGGKVTTDVTADRDFARALVIQPDGKVVVAGVAGYSATSNNADCTMIRYNVDGSRDTSFDGDGIVIADIGPGIEDDDYCRGIAIQPDGKLVLAGRSFVAPPGSYGLVVLRFNPDGSPDTTFDADGKAQFEMPAILEMYGLALQPDGRMIVGGRSFSFTTHTYTGLVVRFNANGSLDASFGSNGSTTASIGGVFSVALQSDGKIIAAGTNGPDSQAAFAISRLNQDGSLDPSFGNGGVSIHHPTLADQTWFARVRFDDQIFVGGHSSMTATDARAALLRFGPGGVVGQESFYPNENVFWNLAFQPDGKALTVGASFVPFSGFTLRRYIDTHMPDATFSGGSVNVKFLAAAVPETSGVNAVAMTPDNKIVAAGSVTEQSNTTTGWRIAVARFHSGLQAPHPERFDFDGDRKADLSIYRPSNGEWWYLRSSDGGAAAARFGNATDVPTPGDYTGDGKTDIAVWRPSTGQWFILRSEDFSYYAIPFGTSGDVPRPSDFDGDGTMDLIVYRPSQNFWYRTNSIGLGSFRGFGIAGDKPLVGDFDGDRRSDIAMYRPATGEWWYRTSTGDAEIGVRWGIASDLAVPSDYDGDGRTDLAVYRPSNGTWYVLNSTDGSYTVVAFGLSDDKPVPADYDGDGKSDIAVFRPSTGVWYLLRSSAGFTATQFGLPTDVPTPGAFVE